ncbi:MAG: hypothetical protein ACD_51C00361G0013 [uncultured bacterium]|nr:MAG: hypothetical protein ACD_51C00361G0013 [uncultured bacterium]OGH14226.1 MAG: hydrolase TatD [Candidatus Levybacteria bacterium RIFCSPHIGHO2_01_FULL_38_26]
MDIKPLVDFHCHLDLYEDHVQLIELCEINAIRTLAVTTTPRAWVRNRDLTKGTKYVRPALGLHPQLIGKDASKELFLWENYLPEAKYIGEVGLDSSPNFSHSFGEQKRVFEHILKCCSKVGGKILTVHSVRSAGIVLEFIEKFLPIDRGAVVLHWFTGTSNEAQRAVNLGCYFSFNVAMLQTKKGQELLKNLPIERILTETDGPFIEWKGRPSKPGDVINTIFLLAKILGIPPLEVSKSVNLNLRYLIEKSI